MNMPKSRDIQAKMPSPKVIYASNESKSVLARNLEECRDNDKNRKACFYRLNAFWLVTVKVLNSYVLEYGQSKIEYLKTPYGAYDRNMEMIYSL